MMVKKISKEQQKDGFEIFFRGITFRKIVGGKPEKYPVWIIDDYREYSDHIVPRIRVHTHDPKRVLSGFNISFEGMIEKFKDREWDMVGGFTAPKKILALISTGFTKI